MSFRVENTGPTRSLLPSADRALSKEARFWYPPTRPPCGGFVYMSGRPSDLVHCASGMGGSARTGCRPVGTVNARCESARRSTGIMTRISLLSIHSGPRAYHGPAPSLQTSGRGGIRGDDAFSPTGLDLMSPSRPRREGKGSGVRKAQPHPVPSAGWLSAGTQGADQR